jgi:RimJ/RimL family protein N-acetyltransferase
MSIIKGKRISLEKFLKKHIQKDYISFLKDKIHLRFSAQKNINYNYNKCLKYYNSFKKTDNLFLRIVLKDSKDLVGTLTCYIDKFNQNAEIGILIGSKFKNMNLGYDAYRTIIHYLFDRGINKIMSGTVSENKAMIKIMKKNGMKFEAKFKNHFKSGNRFFDIVYFSLFKK